MVNQIEKIIGRFRGQPGPLIIVLHAIQEKFGYIPEEAKPVVADGLNLSRAEVHGVVTFYHFFRHHPPGPARGADLPGRVLQIDECGQADRTRTPARSASR